jgi:CBS domain-containing protein
MAESQVPYPNLPVQITAIRASLSEPRFAKYLEKGGGNEAYAIALYLYNARVAKAFMFPLGVVEITLRNAIDALLVTQHGATWHLDVGFRDTVLMPEGLSTLDKAITRAGTSADRSQVIAELTFDFWSNLFRPDYGPLWRTGLNIVFPNLPKTTKRHDVQTMARTINKFRNRVAHHEPVLDLNITDVHASIVELVGLRCIETAAWLKHHSTLSTIIRTRPRGSAAGFVSLGSRLAPDFIAVTETTTLEDVAAQFNRKCQVAVCLDEHGVLIAAFGPLDLIRFLADDTKANDGMTAPRGHTVRALLAAIKIEAGWTALPADGPVAAAVDQLTGKAINIVVGIDAMGAAVGVITRTLRRY